MRFIHSLFILIFFLFFSIILKAQEIIKFNIAVTVSDSVKAAFSNGGRILVHLSSQRDRDPRFKSEVSFGVTPKEWAASGKFSFSSTNKVVLSNGLQKLKGSGKYYYQIVYKQNLNDGNENVEGNLYSDVDSVENIKGAKLKVALKHLIPSTIIVQHPFVKTLVIKSQLLSAFSGRPRYLKASVLLPSGYYNHPETSYPICYRVPGLNGRYDQINGQLNNKEFSDWWFSNQAPQVLYVFLDSQGPYGDTYQMDSENNGPCGKALTEELIPAIEQLVHYNPLSKKRFLAGKSTGGWVALGLQIFYPDFFDGTWSYSPDPVDFEHYGLIDIYHDATIFYNKYGYLQPGKRTIYGEPTFSMKDWIHGENLNSRTGDYRASGGQFGAYNAVFGPRGADGLPSLMFDPITGKIDSTVARQWERYDLKKILEKNWSVLGSKLQGKIWIWMGDMDGLYSNAATRFLQKMLEKTTDPHSDAIIRFTPMAGHTQEWSDKEVLKMVEAKVADH